jgi:catechol 2,3-dioxygenase-like lactoylglutathione lyase family enzyme
MKYHHIALSVSDLEKSSQFYKEVLGFQEVKRFRRDDLGIEALFLKLLSGDDLQLELIRPDKLVKNTDDSSNLNVLGLKHLAFAVESVDKKYADLRTQHYEVTKPIKGKAGQYFFVKDPDGFDVELYEDNK